MSDFQSRNNLICVCNSKKGKWICNIMQQESNDLYIRGRSPGEEVEERGHMRLSSCHVVRGA